MKTCKYIPVRPAMVIFVLLFGCVSASWADDDYLQLKEAKWDNAKSTLTVKGTGQDGEAVVIRDADPNRRFTLGAVIVDNEQWEVVRVGNFSSIPSRVRVEQSDGQVIEENVENIQ